MSVKTGVSAIRNILYFAEFPLWTPSKGNKIILRELDSVTIFYDRNPFIFRDIVANEEKVSNEAKYFKKRYPIKQNILNCCNPEAVVSDAKYIIKKELQKVRLIVIAHDEQLS